MANIPSLYSPIGNIQTSAAPRILTETANKNIVCEPRLLRALIAHLVMPNVDADEAQGG
jgi:hypothetical protein